MNTPSAPHHVPASDVIRWQFRMRDRLLTCGVTRSGRDGFSVVTLPHWDVKGGIVENFASAPSALQRHAMIADRLRSAGWAIASYTR